MQIKVGEHVVMPQVGDDVIFHLNGARLFSPSPEELNADQPMAAKVVYVWGPEMVNLHLLDHQGNTRAVTSVRFVPPGTDDLPAGMYCTMRYVLMEACVGEIDLDPPVPSDSCGNTDQQAEQANAESGARVGPRVTPADIEAQIRSEFFFTAEHGVLGESEMGTRPAAWTNMDQITICVLILRNGVKVVGVNEGPVSRENYSAVMGRQFARQKAIDQIWPMMGYELRTKLTNAPKPNAVDPDCVFRYCPSDDDCKARGRCVNRP